MNESIKKQLYNLNEDIATLNDLNSRLHWLWEKYPNTEVILHTRSPVVDLASYLNEFLDDSKNQNLKTKKYSLYIKNISQEINSFVIFYNLFSWESFSTKNWDLRISIHPFLNIDNEFVLSNLCEYSFTALSYDRWSKEEKYKKTGGYWLDDKFEIINVLKFNNYSEELISAIINKIKENESKLPSCPLKESLNYEDCNEWNAVKYELNYD